MDAPLLNPKRFRQIHAHTSGLKLCDGKRNELSVVYVTRDGC